MFVVVRTAAPAASPCAVHNRPGPRASPRSPGQSAAKRGFRVDDHAGPRPPSWSRVTAHRCAVHTSHHNDQAPEPTQSKINLSGIRSRPLLPRPHPASLVAVSRCLRRGRSGPSGWGWCRVACAARAGTLVALGNGELSADLSGSSRPREGTLRHGPTEAAGFPRQQQQTEHRMLPIEGADWNTSAVIRPV